MFLAILNWMAGHVPGFLRPAVNWLIGGLRDITNYISSRWNALGDAVTSWYQRVLRWQEIAYGFTYRVHLFVQWLVLIRIPQAIGAAVSTLDTVLRYLVAQAFQLAIDAVNFVQYWLNYWVELLSRVIEDLRTWAVDWINRLVVTVRSLIGSLAHVLNGPDALAEWLWSAIYRRTLRLIREQRDRIASWLLRESVEFSRWLAREIEDVIMRWL